MTLVEQKTKKVIILVPKNWYGSMEPGQIVDVEPYSDGRYKAAYTKHNVQITANVLIKYLQRGALLIERSNTREIEDNHSLSYLLDKDY